MRYISAKPVASLPSEKKSGNDEDEPFEYNQQRSVYQAVILRGAVCNCHREGLDFGSSLGCFQINLCSSNRSGLYKSLSTLPSINSGVLPGINYK